MHNMKIKVKIIFVMIWLLCFFMLIHWSRSLSKLSHCTIACVTSFLLFCVWVQDSLAAQFLVVNGKIKNFVIKFCPTNLFNSFAPLVVNDVHLDKLNARDKITDFYQSIAWWSIFPVNLLKRKYYARMEMAVLFFENQNLVRGTKP